MGTQHSQPKAQPIGLLDLPSELRLIIWELALWEEHPVPLFAAKRDLDDTSSDLELRTKRDGGKEPDDNQHVRWADAQPPEINMLRLNVPSLLHTCRLARTEGHSVFYRDNTFMLTSDPAAGSSQGIHNALNKSKYFWQDVRTFSVGPFLAPVTFNLLLNINENGTLAISTTPTRDLIHPLTATEFARSHLCLCRLQKSLQEDLRYSPLSDAQWLIEVAWILYERTRRLGPHHYIECHECGRLELWSKI